MANTINVTIEMELGGEIKLELYPETAPITVQNFVDLVSKKFYDGLIFHRVISGFMIQGGDPTGTGMGGPGHSIKGEFAMNGIKNPLSHTRGVISMARSQHPDSAGSQFFIMHADGKFLDGQYAAFGKVTEGIEIVDRIAETATNRADRPIKEQKIKTIRLA
ncbi:MAG: peptidylprolyl isomerase [Clostridia bacterium]|nr:peptidylprolyl isomerase [Clostridia bacterium]